MNNNLLQSQIFSTDNGGYFDKYESKYIRAYTTYAHSNFSLGNLDLFDHWVFDTCRKNIDDKDLETLKIVLIGESGVGKTSIISQFIDQIFQNDQQSTIGGTFSTKTIKCVKKVKKEGKPEKSEKSEKRKSNNNNKIKKFQVYEDDKEDSLENVKVTRRRGLSCIKRTNRIKI